MNDTKRSAATGAEFLVKLRRKLLFIRKFIPASIRHRFNKLIPKAAAYKKDDSYFLTRDNTNYTINRSDHVQWRIFYGVRDNDLQLAKKFLTPNSIVLDIGANCGGFSLRLATYAAENNYTSVQIHAFEPNPVIFKRYSDNLALNPPIIDIVHPHPIGLGNENGERLFQYPDSNTGIGRVLQEEATGQFKVTIKRLDDFINRLNPPKISFIKMIVEGFEPEVFKGGWNTIRKYKPPIFFEVTKEWYEENNSTIEEVLDKLKEIGYKFTGEYYNDLIPYDPAKFASLYQFNMLATID